MNFVMNPKATTGFTTFVGDDARLTGEERYPLTGHMWQLVGRRSLDEVQKLLSGLRTYWDCIEKNKLAKKMLRDAFVGLPLTQVVGSLMVVSGDSKSAYGYYFNPPYEFHSWLRIGDNPYYKGIVDFALPGVIEKGLNSSDAVGPYLINRTPVILIGAPPTWMQYKEHEEVTG